MKKKENNQKKKKLTLISLRIFGRMIFGSGLLISLIATRSPVVFVLKLFYWMNTKNDKK